MNTKTTKFLAVIAVFALAFAVFAVADDTQADPTDPVIEGVYTDAAATKKVTSLEINDGDVTWYVKADAKITGGDITVAKGAGLKISLAKDVTESNFSIEGATISGAATIDSGVKVIITVGKVMTVDGTLTVYGVLENNSCTTATGSTNGIVIGTATASGAITGTGTICGKAPVLIKMVAGTLENVTVSQEDWEAGQTNSGKAIIRIDGVTGTNTVTIKDITVKMKEMGDEGTHGIGIYDTAAGTTVTIDGAYFTTVDKNTATEEFLLYTNDKTLGNVVFKNISRDSKVLVKEGYGEYTANKTATLGDKVKFDDSGISYLRIAESAKIAGDVKVDNVVLRSVSNDEPTLTIDQGKTLTVNGDITYGGAEGKKAKISNAGTINNNGTTRIEGTVSIEGTGTLTNDGTLVIDKGASILNLTNNKTVRLYEGIIGVDKEATLAGELVNEGTIYVMSENAQINVKDKSGSGTIDTSAVSEEVYISGNIVTSETTFKKNQIVTFIADTTLKAGASIIFNGLAIIPEGVTVTIENGASMKFVGSGGELGKLINNGQLIIEGFKSDSDNATALAGLIVDAANIENNGTIELNFDGKLPEDTSTVKLVDVAVNSTFVNNGIITIGEKSQLNNDATSFVNSATGVIIIYGDLSGAVTPENSTVSKAIINSGLITISSEVNSAIEISNAAVDAKISVMMTKALVTVNDLGIKEVKDKLVNGGNKIILTPAAKTTCGGITITSATFKVKSTLHTALVIEGSLIVSGETIENATLKFESNANGRIAILNELTLTNTTLSTTSNKTNVYVSGEFSITDTSSFENAGVLTVPGILYIIGSNGEKAVGGTINAAKYDVPATVLTPKVTVYTNVPDAIAGAAEASVKTVTVTGTVNIDESIVIPAGMKVKVDNDGETETGKQVLTISKDVVVEVYSDGTDFAILENDGKIQVNGKLIFDDVKKSKKGTTGIINSEVILESGNTVVYTTLAWAIADAGSEAATLKLCGATTITTNMTIPENITVDTNECDFTVSNAELTIDGVLFLNGGTYSVTGDDAKIIVNGAITSESKMPYDGKKFPAGLYFTIGDKATYVIGNIDDAESWSLLADDDKLEYEGDLETIAISFDSEATLTFKGAVTAASMNVGSKAVVNFEDKVAIAMVTVGESTINFAKGKTIEGVFTSPVGTITFDEATVNAASSLKVAVKDTVTTMTLSGDIGTAETTDDYEYQVSTLGDVVITAKLADLYVGLGTTTIGASISIDYILVDGDLVIANEYKLTSKDGYIYGSLTASDAIDTKKKATAVFDYLAVGIDFKDAVGSAAVVYGDVTTAVALVSADATVSDTIYLLPYSTDIYVEGNEVLTVYAASAKYDFEDELEDIEFVISDPSAADTREWVDEDGVEVKSFVVGAYDAIYAVFDYNIYDILIVTDAGIKSVAINGIQMLASGSNSFIMVDLAAGTYKVTYTLKTGYSGEAVLSTSTGTILKDNSFVISPGSETDLSFQLAGTEPTPEPEPVTPEEKSEWTVTTILLVILVILIAIMAVIVALRLNRS